MAKGNRGNKGNGSTEPNKPTGTPDDEDGFEATVTPESVEIDLGPVGLEANSDGTVGVSVELPVPGLPGVTASGGITFDPTTGEIVETEFGAELGPVVSINVAIAGCEIITTITIGIPNTPLSISYSIPGTMPNCEKPEEEEEEEEENPEQPQEVPIPPPGYWDELEQQFIGRNATIARVTWISTKYTYYRRTGNVSRPLEIIKVVEMPGYLPPGSLEEGFGPAELSWYPSSYSFNFRMYMPNGFPWRKLIYFGGSSDPFGRQEYFTRTQVGFGQAWWIKNRRYWMQSGWIISDANGGAPSFNIMSWPLTAGQSSGGSGNPRGMPYPKWIDIYEQDSLIIKPKPIIPPAPPPELIMDNCCAALLRLTREIHEVLDPPSIKKTEIPKSFCYPGATGTIKMKTYDKILEAMMLQANLYGFQPFQAKVADANAGKEGSQPIAVAFNSLSGNLKFQTELGIENAGDIDTLTNICVRLAQTLCIMQKATLESYRRLEAIEEFLDFDIKQVLEDVPMMFDPRAGLLAEKGFGKKPGAKEENTEINTEKELARFLQSSNMKTKVINNVDKRTLRKIIYEIRNVLMANNTGSEVG